MPRTNVELGPITAISAKDLVGAVASQHNGHFLPRRLRHEIGRHGGGVSERLIQSGEDAIEHVAHAARAHADLSVFRAEMPRNGGSERALLVIVRGAVEADGERLEHGAASGDRGGDKGRVDSAGEEDADRHVAEMTAVARLIGMPDGLAPSSVAELDAYLESVRPELRATPAAMEVADYLLNPPGLEEGVAELWGEMKDAVLGSLPDWAEDMYGFAHLELTDDRRAEIRQALGVFDALTIGEPGVLEARQGIELRMRQARG